MQTNSGVVQRPSREPAAFGQGCSAQFQPKEPLQVGPTCSSPAVAGLLQDGVHYHFTSKPQMEKEIADGQFLEYAHVHGNIYGTSVAAVREVAANGKCCILDIDVQGARQVCAAGDTGRRGRTLAMARLKSTGCRSRF